MALTQINLRSHRDLMHYTTRPLFPERNSCMLMLMTLSSYYTSSTTASTSTSLAIKSFPKQWLQLVLDATEKNNEECAITNERLTAKMHQLLHVVMFLKQMQLKSGYNQINVAHNVESRVYQHQLNNKIIKLMSNTNSDRVNVVDNSIECNCQIK